MAGDETSSLEDLRQKARAWLAGDPDDETRAELAAILERGDDREIEERFARNLEFGTAGLRAVLGAGANRMNRAVVLRTSFGVARHLLAAVPEAARRGIVVGYDARRMSRAFAEDAAGVFAAAGLAVHWFDTVVPTPLVAFAVRFLGVVGGIMITASHNPADYNGYKVYGPTGAQIVAPRDEAIARAIALAPSARSIDRDSLEKARQAGTLTVLSDEIEAAYVDGVRNLLLLPRARPSLSIVYTPLHGVGYRVARRVLVACGFAEPIAVGEQVAPDPAFPTTPFPNPEEPGVLDRALALAREKDADLVLANDPDADRLAVAIKDEKGSFVQLSGNQVGVLLGHYLLTEDRRPGDRAVISTVVSSPMLGEIAGRLGAYYEETLTGFKWIASRAMELMAGGKRFVFGYEEALGYAIGDLVRDKDGLAAAALFAEMAAVQKARGTTVVGYLSDLYRKFGFHASGQRSILMPGNEGAIRIEQFMSALRNAPPRRMGAMAVLEWRDHAKRIRVRVGGSSEPLALPASDVLVFLLEGDSRVVIRPSGTEPKLKVYLDHREEIRADEQVGAAEARAKDVLSSLESAVRSLLS